jgi:hypothetical protein
VINQVENGMKIHSIGADKCPAVMIRIQNHFFYIHKVTTTKLILYQTMRNFTKANKSNMVTVKIPTLPKIHDSYCSTANTTETTIMISSRSSYE